MMKALWVAACCLLSLAPLGAHAATSEWATSEGGRMRLMAISQPRNGTIVALLQIEPKPGWRTYWRNPGNAGLPPELDFSGSSNLALQSIEFPIPEIGEDEAGLFIGYHKPISLVLQFKTLDERAPSVIGVKALVGICDKLCLPFMTDFNVPLTPGQPEGEEFTQVLQAQSLLPEKPGKDFQVSDLTITKDDSSIEAGIVLPSGSMPEIAVAPSSGIRLGKAVISEVENGKTTVTIQIKKLSATKGDGTLTLLVKSGDRAMETTLALPR